MGRLISDNEKWSGFSFIELPFIDAYTKGKILLLYEVNFVQKSVIQCIQSSLDSVKYVLKYLEEKKKYFRNENFMIICTQNPNSGGFASKREDISEFLQRFQIVNFNKFKKEELMKIAFKL